MDKLAHAQNQFDQETKCLVAQAKNEANELNKIAAAY
jgi:hypothetical protein